MIWFLQVKNSPPWLLRIALVGRHNPFDCITFAWAKTDGLALFVHGACL